MTTFKLLMRDKLAAVGFVVLAVYVMLALLAPSLPLHDPLEMHPQEILKPPSRDYLLGTDSHGRDVLSRLIFGARVSLLVSVTSVMGAAVVGTFFGVISGYFGGMLDNIVMRIADVLFGFPGLLLALAMAAALGPSSRNVSIAIAVIYLPIFARVARAPALSVKEEEFILATRCIGARQNRIILLHILPNIMAPIVVQASLSLSKAMITEASLSFLGLGTQPPAPSWGSMLDQGRRLMELAWWMAIFPGLAIMLAVLGFNLLGDGLRDVLDPQLRHLA